VPSLPTAVSDDGNATPRGRVRPGRIQSALVLQTVGLGRYKHSRLNSALGDISPMQFGQRWWAAQQQSAA